MWVVVFFLFLWIVFLFFVLLLGYGMFPLLQQKCLVYACVHVCGWLRTYMRACVRARVRACVRTCVRTYMRVCVRVCVCACVPALFPSLFFFSATTSLASRRPTTIRKSTTWAVCSALQENELNAVLFGVADH